MARVTNEELADLIGGVDDGVIGLKGNVSYLTREVGALKDAVVAANGRQRGDHDVLLVVRGNQDNCPARKSFQNGRPAEFLKENWRIIGMIVTITGTLSVALVKTLDMLAALLT